MSQKITYTATYEGQTRTRTSARAYTHASVVRWSNGEVVILSFHGSQAAAMKGTLTSGQKANGARVIAAVPLSIA